jgi:hypothetical protein
MSIYNFRIFLNSNIFLFLYKPKKLFKERNIVLNGIKLDSEVLYIYVYEHVDKALHIE